MNLLAQKIISATVISHEAEAGLTVNFQNSWKIQWTDDEVYSVRLVGSEILVHKYNSYGELAI